MRLIQYMNEKTRVTQVNSNPEEIIQILQNECSEIIKFINPPNNILYRGLSGYHSRFYHIIPRKDRMPLDSSESFHNALDSYFKKKFGWKTRSEGVFTTSRFNEAKTYGTVYYFFPIDGFEFVWSPKIDDISKYVANELEIYIGDFDNRDIEQNYFLKSLIPSYINNDLYKAIRSGHEISFKCPNGYYALYSDEKTRHIITQLKGY